MMPNTANIFLKSALTLGALSLSAAALADTWVVSAKDGLRVMKVDSCKVVETDTGFDWNAQVGDASLPLGSGYKCDGDNINELGTNDDQPIIREQEAINRRAILPGRIEAVGPQPRLAPSPPPPPRP